MKRVVRILLFLIVALLVYMCIASLRQGLLTEGKTPVTEHFEE
jgi:hypothetical protein